MQRFFIVLGFILLSFQAWSTHNRAGEITYKYISGYTYEVKVLTYTYSLSPADRPNLIINWGDGDTSVIVRYNKQFIGNQTNRNYYKGTHTYSGPGSFTISVVDPNRNDGVVNIPNSVNVPFYIESVLVINPFLGQNNSVQLLNPPIDNGCVGFPFYHNPGAYDADGDSISYELAICKGNNGNNIINYTYPAASSSFYLDPITGTLTWDSPIQQGEYNIAIVIKEWRFGIFVGSVRRDMQITIAACNNNPPVIAQLIDTCVEVGSNYQKTILANDIDNDVLKLTATGGPLIQNSNPAVFNQPTYGTGSVSSVFSWTPSCDHVRKQSYQMVFKAMDNGSPVNLVDIKTLKIKVVGPSPQNLAATAQANSILLSWNPYSCSNAVRFDVYRHQGYIGYLPNTCETGVPAWTNYVRVGGTSSINQTTFLDNNNGYGLVNGHDYCYMVVAIFPDSAESYPSLEACASLSKDVPVINKVSVDETSTTTGKMSLGWTVPFQLDSVAVPGPYKYLIYQSQGKASTNFILIDSISGRYDTTYQAVGLNTAQSEYNYKIDFINDQPNNRFVIGNTQIASSIFLNAQPNDKRIKLHWDESVPWDNISYIIYRKNQSGIFDSIGFSMLQEYTDSNLVNGQSYCYKVKSIGKYNSTYFTYPLINWSQEICSTPLDLEPPCPPELRVKADCENLQNDLVWTIPPSCSFDLSHFIVYYTPTLDGDFEEIFATTLPDDTFYSHTNLNSIAGCYVVVAVDSNGNTSEASNKFCVDIDSCRLYKLPNVFTPNGDGYNDVFHPFPYDLVDKINITIYNRWGVPVFNSEDPDVNWDGKDINSKKDCSEGVYFYVCEVFERRLEGLIKRDIKGTVTLLRNANN